MAATLKTAVFILCLASVPAMIVAQSESAQAELTADTDSHCKQPEHADLPAKLKPEEPTGPGAPPAFPVELSGDNFANICGDKTLPEAFCVASGEGSCCKEKECTKPIPVKGSFKFEKKAKVNGKDVTPFPVNENVDTEITVTTPKGFKSKVQVYLTSEVSFDCPDKNKTCKGDGVFIETPMPKSPADVCKGGPSCITTTISLAAVNCLHPCGECEKELKPTIGNISDDQVHPPFAPSPPPPDTKPPVIDASPVIVKPGDVNIDGAVNIQDTVFIASAILGTGSVLSGTAFIAADLNSDGEVSVMDEVLGIEMIVG